MNESNDVKQLKEKLEQLESEYLQAVLDSQKENPLEGKEALVAVKIIFKKKAIDILKKKGIDFDNHNISFASNNKADDRYWLNPNFNALTEKWYLILDDAIRHQLHLFIIPANSIAKEKLLHRKSRMRPEKYAIYLTIAYNDPLFTDTHSGYQFLQFLSTTISYKQ